jgi:hypothetical protein
MRVAIQFVGESAPRDEQTHSAPGVVDRSSFDFDRGSSDRSAEPSIVFIRRRFQWPARLTANDRLILTIVDPPREAEVRLNGESLGRGRDEAGGRVFMVTRSIRLRNELEIAAPIDAKFHEIKIPEARLTVSSDEAIDSDHSNGPDD